MSTTPFAHPFTDSLGNPPGPVSPQVEAFVTRVARLALRAAQRAPLAAVMRALAADSEYAVIGALVDLLKAGGSGSALAHLLDANGGVWGEDEAQARLGIDQTTLQGWRKARTVIALPQPDGSFSYPAAQFAPAPDDGGLPTPYPDLQSVLEAIGDGLTPEETVAFLLTPQPALAAAGTCEPVTGMDAIARHETDAVVALLRHALAPADAGAPAA